ncbi:DinB family protein [Paenibacillus sp. Dod16]|uniref:DinB family protein n=1 Tax=Paenibacillus sp. Dod16 TaxID=3416392 RepID=UPI003CF84F08
MESIMKLESLITEMTEIVTSTNEVEFNLKLAPDKWSKKEILGHLCDSAVNNHIRFVKILLSDYPIAISGYTQNDWVRVNDYQDQYDQSEVLSLWQHLNRMILRVMHKADSSDFQKKRVLPDKTEVTLEWLFNDYVDHMIHHLEQIEL